MVIEKTLKQQRDHGELIHHSDHQVQYCSGLYRSLHKQHRVKCLMTDTHNCHQNALRSLKESHCCKACRGWRRQEKVRKAVDTYNLEQPHRRIEIQKP